MLPFSGNNQNIKIVWSSPEHFAIGYVQNDNLPLENIALQYVISKQLQEGLMVFSDDYLHFLKIKNFFCRIHPNYLVALMLNRSDIKFLLSGKC